MSQLLEDFMVCADLHDWPIAIRYCNGLNMTEMLQGLNYLQREQLDDMQAQLGIYANQYGWGAERIAWAMEVVRNRRLPAAAPGDLEATGQVQDARNFLARASARRPPSQKRLKITLFWTRNAQSESFSSALIQKAQELLRLNGDRFTLDVLPVRTILPTDKTLNETDPESCGSSDFVEVQQLATSSPAHTVERLPVIFYMSETVLGPYGTVRDPISHGCGYQPSPGKGFAMINGRGVGADRVTLLHEVGHGAGMPHEPDGSGNFMSRDSNRSKINPTQLAKFARAFFCA
jgi:hypothetical protein